MKLIRSVVASNIPVLKPLGNYNEKLCINTQNAKLIITKSEISYLKADSNYCKIQLLDGRSIVCCKTLKEINCRIANPNFIKVHQSYVVNMDRIASLNSSYSQLTLTNGAEIPISRAQKSIVREVIHHMFD